MTSMHFNCKIQQFALLNITATLIGSLFKEFFLSTVQQIKMVSKKNNNQKKPVRNDQKLQFHVNQFQLQAEKITL